MKTLRAFLLLFALPVLAQNASEPSFDRLKERFPDRSRTATYIAIFDDLHQGLKNNPAWDAAGAPAARIREALDKQLGAVIDELAAVNASLGGDASADEASTEFLVADRTTERFREDTVSGWFDQPGQPAEQHVTDAHLAAIDTAAADDFRARTDAANRALKEFGSHAIADTRAAIEKINAKWELFLNKGPSQFPWESLINGYIIGAESIEQPPTHQWIVAHPLPIFELSNPSIENLEGAQGLAIEVLGHAFYRFSESNKTPRLKWFGASAMIAMSEGRQPSWGIMGHYNRTYTAGVVWSDAEDVSDPSLVLGVDLYQLVQKRAPEYRDRLRRLGAFAKGGGN